MKGEYPFVQLDSHRASCAICLLDFQEPRRVSSGPVGSDLPKTPVENQGTEASETRQEGEGENEDEGDITEQTTTPATPTTPASPTGDMALRLQDAGQGAQPLRLLKCGHVFHVSSLSSMHTCVSDANDPLLKENMCRPVVARCIGTMSSVSASCP